MVGGRTNEWVICINLGCKAEVMLIKTLETGGVALCVGVRLFTGWGVRMLSSPPISVQNSLAGIKGYALVDARVTSQHFAPHTAWCDCSYLVILIPETTVLLSGLISWIPHLSL